MFFNNSWQPRTSTRQKGYVLMLSRSVMSNSLQPHGLQPARTLHPWGFFKQQHWSGLPALLQGIFPTHGLNPDLPHCRWILYCLSHQGSPRMLDWIVYPFSRGSFQPRNRTGVSCIAGRFFTSCATREAHPGPLLHRI